MRVKELNLNERPREKALEKGMQAMSNRDLLAVLLGSGTKGCSSLELADMILNQVEHVGALATLGIEDLMKMKGIKSAKAISLLAAVELSRRMCEDQMKKEKIQIEHPNELVAWLRQKIGYAKQEQFVAVYLDHRNQILKHQVLFVGSDCASIVSAKEIYRLAVSVGASKVIVAHNHPSGSLEPSKQDLQVTKALVDMGNMMGIPLLDHLIVSHYDYCSLRGMQLM